MNKLRVLLADDHEMMREGLKLLVTADRHGTIAKPTTGARPSRWRRS